MTRTLLCSAVALLTSAAAFGQSNVPGSAGHAPPGVEVEQPARPAYAYDPEGRRDPFLSLVGRGNDSRSQGVRAGGVAGLLIAEATVKGTLRDRSGFLALIQSPDKRTYLVRPGDRLMDGSVKAIGQDKVIFSQEITDPLSLVKQREIPKTVRPVDGRGEPMS